MLATEISSDGFGSGIEKGHTGELPGVAPQYSSSQIPRNPRTVCSIFFVERPIVYTESHPLFCHEGETRLQVLWRQIRHTLATGAFDNSDGQRLIRKREPLLF